MFTSRVAATFASNAVTRQLPQLPESALLHRRHDPACSLDGGTVPMAVSSAR